MINAPLPTPIPIATRGIHGMTCLPIPFKFEPPPATLAVPTLVIDDKNNNVDRKRKRTSETSTTTTTLSRDELLKFSSKEYEDYVRSISREKPLSPQEQREVKRQRRLIKNREYAQTSRNKKKEQVGLMEIQLQKITNENDSLLNQVSTLNDRVHQLEETKEVLLQENRQLKDVISRLSSSTPLVLEQTLPDTSTSTSTSSTFSPTESIDDSSEVDLFISSLTSDSEDSSTSPTEPVPPLYDLDVNVDDDPFNSFGWPTSNVFTLFIVLFSFGLFFNSMNFSQPSFVPTNPDPVPAASVPVGSVPEVSVPVRVNEMDSAEKSRFRSLLLEREMEGCNVPDIFPFEECDVPEKFPLRKQPISMLDVLVDEISVPKSSFSDEMDPKFNNNNNETSEQSYLPVSYTGTVLVEV